MVSFLAASLATFIRLLSVRTSRRRTTRSLLAMKPGRSVMAAVREAFSRATLWRERMGRLREAPPLVRSEAVPAWLALATPPAAGSVARHVNGPDADAGVAPPLVARTWEDDIEDIRRTRDLVVTFCRRCGPFRVLDRTRRRCGFFPETELRRVTLAFLDAENLLVEEGNRKAREAEDAEMSGAHLEVMGHEVSELRNLRDALDRWIRLRRPRGGGPSRRLPTESKLSARQEQDRLDRRMEGLE